MVQFSYHATVCLLSVRWRAPMPKHSSMPTCAPSRGRRLAAEWRMTPQTLCPLVWNDLPFLVKRFKWNVFLADCLQLLLLKQQTLHLIGPKSARSGSLLPGSSVLQPPSFWIPSAEPLSLHQERRLQRQSLPNPETGWHGPSENRLLLASLLDCWLCDRFLHLDYVFACASRQVSSMYVTFVCFLRSYRHVSSESIAFPARQALLWAQSDLWQSELSTRPKAQIIISIWDVLRQIKWPGAKIGWSPTIVIYTVVSYGVAIWFRWLRVVFVKRGRKIEVLTWALWEVLTSSTSKMERFNFEAFPYYVPPLICSNFTHRTSRSWLNHSLGPCECIDGDF